MTPNCADRNFDDDEAAKGDSAHREKEERTREREQGEGGIKEEENSSGHISEERLDEKGSEDEANSSAHFSEESLDIRASGPTVAVAKGNAPAEAEHSRHDTSYVPPPPFNVGQQMCGVGSRCQRPCGAASCWQRQGFFRPGYRSIELSGAASSSNAANDLGWQTTSALPWFGSAAASSSTEQHGYTSFFGAALRADRQGSSKDDCTCGSGTTTEQQHTYDNMS